jgi:hypothetical protein
MMKKGDIIIWGGGGGGASYIMTNGAFLGYLEVAKTFSPSKGFECGEGQFRGIPINNTSQEIMPHYEVCPRPYFHN